MGDSIIQFALMVLSLISIGKRAATLLRTAPRWSRWWPPWSTMWVTLNKFWILCSKWFMYWNWKVALLLDLDANVTQSLLQANKWDKERLIECFFADPEKTLADAGLDLFSPAILARIPKEGDESKSGGTFKCRICYDSDSDLARSFALGCDHLFCSSCFSEYLKNQVHYSCPLPL